MKANVREAIERLIADPAATEGEREAARARLAAAGERIPPPPPPTAVGAPAPWPEWTNGWTMSTANTGTSTWSTWTMNTNG